MMLENRPVLRIFAQLAILSSVLVLAAVAIDLFSRLGVHHPNMAAIITLSILAAIFAIGWLINRRRVNP